MLLDYSCNFTQDRYPELMRLIRQWRHLKMLKRFGRGHDPGGVATTQPGSCAVQCPACPHPGVNLPEDWQNAPPERRYGCQFVIMIMQVLTCCH